MARTVFLLGAVLVWAAGAPAVLLAQAGLVDGLRSRLGSVRAAVGVLEGDPLQEFGDVTAVALLSDGRFVVLDGRSARLTLFSAQGGALGAVGRPGAGPGEFRVARRILSHGPRTLLVLDSGLSRVSVFEVGEDGITFTRSFPVETPAEDICALGDSLYLVGARPGGSATVRRYRLDGTPAGAFGGPLVESPDPVVSAAASQGMRVACLPSLEMVVVAGRWVPIVIGYGAGSGGRQWVAEVPGFLQTVIERDGSGIAFRPPAARVVHLVNDLLVLPGDSLVIQLERMSRRDGGPVQSVREGRVFTITAGAGMQARTWVTRYRVLAWTADRVALVDTTYHPRIIVVGARHDD